ncbi:MAG: fumarate/nitrate reduction transcriptional regulator Fnr [Pseudohongiellaceae bacterium]|nr:fumarate/nitrate reduction transcriptional regulator Fnr [Pseudohongiellaceae bacterium]
MSADRQIRCGNCAVAKLCLPTGLSDSEIGKMEEVAEQKRQLNTKEYLYKAGDSFSGLYAVRSGSFKSVVVAANGDSQITSFTFPGEILGLDAYKGKSHTSYAEALETSSVCALPFDQLESLAQRIPALQRHVYSIFSEEIQQENEILLLLGKRSAEMRMAAFLINLSSRYSQRGYSASQFHLSMSRGDIANYLGLTVETVSRLLNRLQKTGAISVTQRQVEITNMLALSELAGTHCAIHD